MEKSIKQFTRRMIGVSIAFFGFLAIWFALTKAVDPPYLNVGLTVSWTMACLAIYGLLKYSQKRPAGKTLTWGEAMTGATLVFGLMFWIYGVVPHLWITFSDSELSWRSSRGLGGPTLPTWLSSNKEQLLQWLLPFNLNYQVLRDLVAVVIYAIALGGNVVLFLLWQKRGIPAPDEPEETETSKYGRPLIEQNEETS